MFGGLGIGGCAARLRRLLGEHRILERRAFRIVVGKPPLGRFLAGEDLEVLSVADLFAGVDADENGHGSRASCAAIEFLCRVYKEAPEPSSHFYAAMRISRRSGILKRQRTFITLRSPTGSVDVT
jgi:hypothetical protein